MLDETSGIAKHKAHCFGMMELVAFFRLTIELAKNLT